MEKIAVVLDLDKLRIRDSEVAVAWSTCMAAASWLRLVANPPYSLPAFLPAEPAPTIQPWEVYEKLKRVNTRKAAGPDQIPGRLIKEFACELSEPLADILNHSLQDGIVPPEWKSATVVPLPKSKPPSTSEIRPISLTSLLSKVAESFITQWTRKDILPQIDSQQFGCLPGRSTTHSLLDLTNDLYKSLDCPGNICSLVTTDYSKAFDRVDNSLAITTMLELGLRPSLARWIANFLSDRSQCVRYHGSLSDSEKITCGLPQGTLLGPWIFIAYINGAAKHASTKRWKFVDDLNLLEVRPLNAPSTIQQDLADLQRWSSERKMALHPKKCKVMHFLSAKSHPPLPKLTINDLELQNVSTLKILGIHIQSNLKWSEQVVHLYELTSIFTIYIRPTLEYAAPVWHSGLTGVQSKAIERVQRRAVRIILGRDFTTYRDACSRLGLPLLSSRREDLTRAFATSLRRLTGQLDSQSDVPDACYITAPVGVAKAMTCELVDTLSSLMVIGSEQLVSRVIKVKVQDGTNFQFPVTVIVPFRARYRGNYRDVAVKVVDGEKKASYITPLTTEGTYGGQRGSFAEVRVYSLGLFAVVSCLKRETYTVPRRGLSLKLPMDPRICLDYLPGSFTAPVITQSMVQPVDATLLASLKSRSDAYHSVVSTSPLLYLTHPSSQPLRRPLTLTLPCPPNPEKKRAGKREEPVHNIRPASASPLRDQATSHRVRMLSASVKSSKEISNELLVLLGSRDQQWNVLDKVAVRNLQNGLVSFELTENFERLLVVRLLSSGRPCPLTSLVEELEESICCHAVTIILQSRQEEPHAVLVAAVPSRDLSWELTKLRAQGYGGGLPETSSEISMREGDQLLLRFSGNVTATGTQNNHGAICERITFHSQRKNHLFLRLAEVDPFGNYSSAHYKGTAMFYKLTRGQREWTGDNMEILPDPVCTLALTLPKKVRTINRPISAKVKLYEETGPLSDSLLLWLSRELSEGELALLVLSLRLRRSTTQLVKLRARDSLSAQAFHLLALWRRGQPAAPHPAKASQLAHCLAKSGRPDLARELLLRQAAATRRGS
ncbi:death domain-containing protein 1 [Diretmus argenteus]